MLNKKILLVDDNADDILLVTRAFRKLTFVQELIVASDGVEALKYLFGDKRGGDALKMEELPSLVLLDIKMPRINGLDVLREIRADEKTKTIPVVIFTSSCEESDIIASRKLGANNYIQKPVNYSDFIEAIRQLVFSMNLHLPAATE